MAGAEFESLVVEVGDMDSHPDFGLGNPPPLAWLWRVSEDLWRDFPRNVQFGGREVHADVRRLVEEEATVYRLRLSCSVGKGSKARNPTVWVGNSDVLVGEYDRALGCDEIPRLVVREPVARDAAPATGRRRLDFFDTNECAQHMFCRPCRKSAKFREMKSLLCGGPSEYECPRGVTVDASKMPPLREQAASFFTAMGAAAWWRLLGRQIEVTREEQEERVAICRGCFLYNEELGRCSKCGCCVRRFKSRLRTAHCPIGKW